MSLILMNLKKFSLNNGTEDKMVMTHGIKGIGSMELDMDQEQKQINMAVLQGLIRVKDIIIY